MATSFPAAAQEVARKTPEAPPSSASPPRAESAPAGHEQGADDPEKSKEGAPPHEPAPARDRRGLLWPNGQRQVSWGEVAAVGVLAGGVVAVRHVGSTETPRWTRVNGFDTAVRRALRLEPSHLETIAMGSNVTLYAVAAYPVVVEDIGLVLIRNRNPRLLAELAVIDGQAFAMMGLAMGISKLVTARQRPYAYGLGCSDAPNGPGCGTDDRNRAFFSGHSAMSFTGAGLVCFHNQLFPNLYGKPAIGRGVCGAALAVATSTALFRVMGDKHWGSDVIAGAGVGLFSGWMLPWLLHGRDQLDISRKRASRNFLRVERKHVKGSFSPLVNTGVYGASFNASF